MTPHSATPPPATPPPATPPPATPPTATSPATKRPIAVTMGDPNGIGPEITVKAYADPRRRSPVVVIGDPDTLARACRITDTRLTVRPVDSVAEAAHTPGTMDVLAEGALPADLSPGTVDARAGAASFQYVRRGIELALGGEIRALTTAPINKEALRLAGLSYPGHTEILAELSGTSDYAMMMANDELRVVLVTVHQSLRTALDALTTARELEIIRLTHRTLRTGGRAGPRPRIAVAALNPHAGENGLFGREDLDIIEPAVRAARREGIDASGPWPADTVFMRARAGEFDAVVAQYHDQGLIPVKYMGLEHGVNITIGLPFVRTSVDHGTAFDLAGRGTADHTSLLTALHHADELSGAGAGAPAEGPSGTDAIALPDSSAGQSIVCRPTPDRHPAHTGPAPTRRTPPWTSSSCSPVTTGPSPTASTSSTPSGTSGPVGPAASATSASRTSASSPARSPAFTSRSRTWERPATSRWSAPRASKPSPR
ncbi:4-hydroxythreonine-4-phosphate dehydrogenase PdxA [Streptomyces sp. NPDC059875]|uniref:4-hydroxythreonine-4-phosphate dehydrogenase PdxA n=1 Tax=unclassified Streptomyces TaxID=2593676 RepID=UPI003659CCE3